MWLYRSIKTFPVIALMTAVVVTLIRFSVPGDLPLGMLSPTPVYAQQSAALRLEVSPQVQYLKLKPGEETTHTLELSQQGTTPLRINPSVRSFVPSGDGTSISFTTEDIFPYVTIDTPEPEIFLDSGESTRVPLTIAPPENLTGEFPLTVLFQAQSADDSPVAVNGTIGSNLIVTIQNYENDQAELDISSIQAPRFVDSFGSIEFSILASNRGSNASFASGSATVSGLTGTEKYPFEADMILSGYNRLLRSNQTTATNEQLSLLSPGESVSDLDIKEDISDIKTSQLQYKRPFLIGPYTITAELRENAVEQSYNSTEVTVIAAPFSLIIIAIIGVITWFCWKYVREL